MAQKEIDEEILIIREQAKDLKIDTADELIEFVKVTLMSANRLIYHVSNLADRTNINNESISNLENSITSLADSTKKIGTHSESAYQKSKKATRISLCVLVAVVILGSSFVWSSIPTTYKVAVISCLIGLGLPYVVRLIVDEWKS